MRSAACWPRLTAGVFWFQAAARATVVCATPHSLAMARALSPARMRARAILTWWSVSLGLRPNWHAPSNSCLAAVCCPLDDALPLVLGQSRQECQEAPPEGRGEVKVWFVEHLHGRAASVHTLHDLDAIHHGARGPVPLGQHEHVAGTKSINGLLELGPALENSGRWPSL